MPKQIKTEDLINSIVQMKVQKGASNKTILDFLQNDLEYGQTYAYQMLKEARKRIQVIWDKQTEGALEESKAQLEEMYEKAFGRKDYKLALEVRKEMNKMLGLNSPEKIDITSGGDKITEIKIIEVKNGEKPGDENNDGVQSN